MPDPVRFTVNGQTIDLPDNPDTTLVRFLRETLHLTGTKEGCDGLGHCGLCTVLVDGKPQLACRLRLADVVGKQMLTIEGLADAKSGRLHPLQQSFIRSGAVQCGFCTPGIILAAKALLDRNPHPSPEEIKLALNLNLCRCTGYASIIEAVQEAAQILSRDIAPSDEPLAGAIGYSVIKPDAADKVTGRALYAADLFMDGMLHGRVLWSAHPHAEVLAVRTTAARSMPGVRAVLTAKDVPGLNRFGVITADQPVLAEDRVRCVSDAVALVFAETAETASAALEKIEVDYRPLSGVFSPSDALRSDAPQLHDKGNVLTHLEVQTGDVDAALAGADVVVDDHYSTPFVDQGFLEPEAGMAVANEDESLTIWTGVQNPFDIRRQVAAAVNLPVEKVRIINMAIGGAFGGKCDCSLQIHLALGALVTRRPVKMVFTRAESLRTHPKRHAFEMHYRVGATRAGKLVGIDAEIIGDTGAYASWGQIVMQSLASFACGAYVVPNARIDLKAVYTNNPPAGAWRGFGDPQVHVALESQMDQLARKLEIGPFEFRLRNAIGEGSSTYIGQALRHSVGFKNTLVAAKKALMTSGWQFTPTRPSARVGVGVASGFKSVGFPITLSDSAGAKIEVDATGLVLLRVGCPDLGQGSDTTLAQIAAEVLDLPADRVRMQPLDTSISPEAGPTVASRATTLGGNAALGAARKLREKLISAAAELLGREQGIIGFRHGIFVDLRTNEKLLTLEDLAAHSGEELCAEHRFVEATTDRPTQAVRFNRATKSPQDFYYTTYAYATQVAVVEVDEDTGKTTVRHIIAAHDVGKAVHPRNVEGQIQGGCLMAAGTALTEEFRVEKGLPLTHTLAQCGLTRIRQAPDIVPVLIENPEPAGPFGAKGIGEVATVPTAAAILNAIHDAVGVRITELPATATRVRAAIEASRCEDRTSR